MTRHNIGEATRGLRDSMDRVLLPPGPGGRRKSRDPQGQRDQEKICQPNEARWTKKCGLL